MSSEMPRVGRVVETALYVDDLVRARNFYVDVFGARVMLDTARLLALDVNGESVLLLFSRGETLQPLDTPGGRVPAHGASGVQHLAFAIAAREVDTWLARLASAGVEIESRVRWPRGGESIYVRDPDGHSVELITPGLWAIY